MIWYFRKKFIRLKDQIQSSDSDLIFCDRTIHCWRRLSYFRPAYNELYLPKRCKLIFMPNIINKNKMKKISRNPLYHFHIFGRTTVYTYILMYMMNYTFDIWNGWLHKLAEFPLLTLKTYLHEIMLFTTHTRTTYLLLCCVWTSSRQAFTKILEFH